jgi:hypothetical protein
MNLPLINADERRYAHSELTEKIIGVFYEVYNELGYGFLESVYGKAFKALREKASRSKAKYRFRFGFAVRRSAALSLTSL